MLLLTVFLAFFGAAGAPPKVTLEQPRIAGTFVASLPATSAERLIFDAKGSTTFVSELASFLSEALVADPWAQLVETFRDSAITEGVASSPSGNLVDLAYDWIDRNEWKYFVRLEVNLPAFEALMNAAKEDSLYRDLGMASLIYGGQGILDFKQKVPDYIDDVHQQQEFQTVKFKPQNKKDAQWAYRLAARQVDIQLARYRPALAYLHTRGVDDRALEHRAAAEPNPQLGAILLHYAELMRSESQHFRESDDFRLRIAILLSDVERNSPDTVNAVLRIGEKNKQVVFDADRKAFDAECAAFRFLVEQPLD